MRSVLCAAVALGTMILWAPGSLQAQEGLTKRDPQGPVTVTVTLASRPAIGAHVKATVALDTHSVALDGIVFEEVVAMRTPEGTDIAPTAVEQSTGGGHHRAAVLVFPPLAYAGGVRIVVKGVGGVAERSFVWEPAPAR